MTQTTSRERFPPKQGGFKTRPYKSPDLCAASRKRGLWASADCRSGADSATPIARRARLNFLRQRTRRASRLLPVVACSVTGVGGPPVGGKPLFGPVRFPDGDHR